MTLLHGSCQVHGPVSGSSAGPPRRSVPGAGPASQPGFGLRLSVTLLLLLTGFGPSTVALEGAESLVGTLEFGQANLHGASLATTTSLDGFRASAGGQRLEAQLDANASGVDVRWRRTVDHHYGRYPGDDSPLFIWKGEQENGSAAFRNVSVRLSLSGPYASVLLVAPDGLVQPLDVRVAEWARVFAFEGPPWMVGDVQGGQVGQANKSHFLVTEHAVKQGLPILETTNGNEMRARGDLTLHVWEANVTLRDDQGRTREFRSGSWSVNETGSPAVPGGVAWDEESQILEIRLINASLEWRQRSGLGELASNALTLVTQGSVSFEAATGLLKSATDTYEASSNNTLELVGRVEQDLKASHAGGRLDSAVQAQGEVRRVRADPRVMESHAFLELEASQVGLGVVGLLGMVAGLGWAASRWPTWRLRDRSVQTRVKAAELAVGAGRNRRARLILDPLLKEFPEDPNVWRLHSARLFKNAEYRRVVQEIEPRLASGGAHVNRMALTVARAHAILGNRDALLRCLEVAVQDPVVAEDAREEPLFRAYEQDAEFRRLVKPPQIPPAYA